MTNYRDKFLGNKTVKVNTKNIDRKEKAFLNEELSKVSDTSIIKVEKEIESANFIYNFNKLSKIYRPKISYKDPSTFAFYGSAETYYKNAFQKILNMYPYDGSRNERISWSISASALDLAILQHEYPKCTAHVNFSPTGVGNQTDSDSSYRLTDKVEYISFAGGPRKKSTYNVENKTGKNITIDPTEGNTVEFWLNKASFGHSFKEVILDVTTPSYVSGSDGYGRFLVEVDASSANKPVTVSYISSSLGFVNQAIGQGVTTSTIADGQWHHYAVSVANIDGSLRMRLYIDGTLNDTVTQTGVLGEVKSPTSGSIGALGAESLSLGGLGWGKLSGSLDHFRFWKTERNPKEVGTYYDRQVYGGTPSDNSNPELGVYYKFNEGILGNLAQDATVLDYSGRINNATFVGIQAVSRALGSAISLSTMTTEVEEGDPIILPTHPDIERSRTNLVKVGKTFDRNNHSALRNQLPQWVYDEDVHGANNEDSEIGILVQAMSSEFDNIKAMIDNVLNIHSKETQDFTTVSSTVNYGETHLFGCADDLTIDDTGIDDSSALADFALAKEGFQIHKFPLVDASGYLEHFYSMSDERTFSQETRKVKDKILKNIHKNMAHINKTKGTEESFRNLIRCFGVGENLIRLNVYSQNEEREIKNEPVYLSVPKKSLSFEGDNKGATLFQQTSSVTADTKSFISGTQNITPWSAEASFIFPKKAENVDIITHSSLYGAGPSLEIPSSTSGDSYGKNEQITFNVSAIKYSSKNKAAYFKLTSSYGLFSELTSSFYNNVYDNSKWNFAVIATKEGPVNFGNIDSTGYNVEFIGRKYDLDILSDSFHLTASISQGTYEAWSKYNKSFYMGAERSFLTGTLVNSSDARALFLNIWSDAISSEDIREHAYNVNNYGRTSPQLIGDHNLGKNELNSDSLVLSWNFDSNPSFTDNVMTLIDFASGSVEDIKQFGEVRGYMYPGKTSGFVTTGSAIIQEHVAGVEYVEVDNAYTSDRVKIKEGEFEKFEVDSRPVTYTFSFEKSMYQTVSQQMLNFLAGLTSFNNMIGEPVNKYRQDYKSLQKMADRFFSRVGQSPDLDKFVEYYKWIDKSLAGFLNNLQPANSSMITDLKNVVESHTLERNKYQHPFPTVEFKDPKIPTAPLLGVNELLYDWEYGHAPNANEIYGARRTTYTFNLSTLNTSDIAVDENLDIGDGTTTVRFTFKAASGTTPFNAAGATQIGTGGNRPIALVTAELAEKINNSALTIKATSSGNQVVLIHDNPAGIITTSEDHEGSDCVLGSDDNVFTHSDNEIMQFVLDDNNCLWQKDRKEHTEARNKIRDRIVTQVSGSTYVLRNLTKPYKYSVDRQDFLQHGSNRKANKNKDFYKIVNSGHEITLNKQDIYEFRKCDDQVDPQRERIYTVKTNTEGTNGYLDADGDMIFPFTLYSSSVGVDFADFKQNLSITNNHDDLESSWIQSPFVFAHNGGMPHRRVPFGTANQDRPEGYELSSSATTLTLKASSQRPKSMLNRESSAGRLMNISNVKSVTGSLLLGNYTKDYEIVLTNGRSLNNNYFVDNEGSFLGASSFVASNYVSGGVDFKVPDRGRTEHVIVNRFSAPGSPESMGPAGLDRVAEEYSINDTVNYRNSTIRGVLDILSAEYSGLHGYRTSSISQPSLHMTNRNPMRFTGSLGNEFDYDNFFVQHPIPQNDYGYSWITASAAHDVYEFLSKNANHGHQHNFNISGTLDSKETITFLGSSQSQAQLSFVGLNQFVVSSVDIDTNTLSGPTQQSSSTYLNDQTLNFHGPYGWPSWKQLRGGDHPVMRRHRKDNTYSILIKGSAYDASAKSEYKFAWHEADRNIFDVQTRTNPRTIKNYKDMPVTSRFNPIVMTKHQMIESTDTAEAERRSLVSEPERSQQWAEQGLWFGDEYYFELYSQGSQNTTTPSEGAIANSNIYGGTISMRMTLPNDVTTYSNSQIIKDFEIDEMKSSKKQNFLNVVTSWFPPNAEITSNSNGVMPELREINYIETIYPKEINTYTKNARTREGFVFHGWNSSRPHREAFLSGNVSYGSHATYTGHQDLSAFPFLQIVDNKNFKQSFLGRVDAVNRASTGSSHSSMLSPHITSSTWVMDARKDFNTLPYCIDSSFRTAKEAFLNFNDQGTRGEGLLQNDYGIFAMGYNGLYGTPPLSLTYNRRIPQEAVIYSNNFETETAGQTPSGWTENSSNNVRVLQNSDGNKILAFVGSTSSNNRLAALTGTRFTGSTVVKFDVMAAGGALGVEYGIDGTGGTNSQQTPTGDSLDLQYALESAPSTWVTVREIEYESSMQTSFKPVEILITASATTAYNVRLLNVTTTGGHHDKWGVDNFRVVKNVLSGEAKFQTADSKLGPFYDSYEDYRDEIRRVGQDHSVVPEFKISDFIEEYYDSNNPGDTSRMRNEFLSLTGAIHNTSSGDLQVGTQFFKSYGNSEFMKYFGSLEESLESDDKNFSPTRLTLRCQAAMKFLPYKGFFPAERVEQIGEIFARTYMPSGSFSKAIDTRHATTLSSVQKEYLLDRRIEASKQQVMKPLFGPGVLNNSIKAGLAVDYPIFQTNFEDAYDAIASLSGSAFLTGTIDTIPASAVIYHYTSLPLTANDTITIENTAGTSKVYTAKSTGNLHSQHFSASSSVLSSLKECIVTAHSGSIKVQGPIVMASFGAGTLSALALEQTSAGTAGNKTIASSITPQGGVDPLSHSGFTGGAGGEAIVGITGSIVNSSRDAGIPRVSGSVTRRVDFEDVLYPEDLYGLSIPDNEPHSSASLLYGNGVWNKVVERPATFGDLNKSKVLDNLGVNFQTNRSTFASAMVPFKSAMHNFAAETVSFFLHDQKLETIVSPPVKLEIEDERNLNKEYKMRVYLQNADTTMYDRHSAFGPPVDDGTNDMVFYERGAPVTASAVLTIASGVLALTAAKNGTGVSAPTHAEMSSSTNPRIVLAPINGDGEVAESGSIIFYDPKNYYNTTVTPAVGPLFASASVTFDASAITNTHNQTTGSSLSKEDQPLSLSTSKLADFSFTDPAASVTTAVRYYDPLDFIRFSKFDEATNDEALSFIELTWRLHTAVTSMNFDGSNAANYPGFDLVKTVSGTETDVIKFRFWSSGDTTSMDASITGTSLSHGFNFIGGGTDFGSSNGSSGIPASRTSSSSKIFYINIDHSTFTAFGSNYTNRRAKLMDCIEAQIDNFSGTSDFTTEETSGTGVQKLTYNGSDKATATITYKSVSADRVISSPSLTEVDFSAYQAAGTPALFYRAQWCGTNGTNRPYGASSLTTAGWLQPGASLQNIYSLNANPNDGAGGHIRHDLSDHMSISGSQASVYVSARDVKFAVAFTGSGMPAEITPIASNSVDIKAGATSETGNKCLAFDGARSTLSSSPTYSYASSASAPDGSTTYNGFQFTDAIAAPFVVTFDFCHAATNSTIANRYGQGSSQRPRSTFDYLDDYTGGPQSGGSADNDHLYAQYSTDGGSNWTTMMEIAPNDTFADWTTGGFAVQASEMNGPSNGTSCLIRIISAGNSSADTDVWLMDNILIHALNTSTSDIQSNLCQLTVDMINGGTSNGDTVGSFKAGSGAAVTASRVSATELKLTADVAVNDSFGYLSGRSMTTSDGTDTSLPSGNQDVEVIASVTSLAGGVTEVPETSVKAFYDITGSALGHNTADNIRYCPIRPHTAAGDGDNNEINLIFSAEQLRDQLKSEIDALNTNSLLSNLVTENSSTNKIIVKQVYGGEKGNNDPGPGHMVLFDGHNNAGSILDHVLTSVASSVFTGGGISNDVRPVSRTVPNMHGFAPYVPPYLDRNASPYVEYTFIPRELKTYNAVEIVDQLTASYYNFHKVPGSSTTNTNYKEAMTISASIDLTQLLILDRDRYIRDDSDVDGDNRIVEQNPDFSKYGYRWAMQPKWETPVHDFTTVDTDALRIDNNTVASTNGSPWKDRYWSKYYDEFEETSTIPYLTASTGMWHQFGKNLEDSNKGYYLRIEDEGKHGLASAVGFLEPEVRSAESRNNPSRENSFYAPQRSIDVLSTKLGKISTRKQIKEAVVAIPYYLDDSCNVNFFHLDQKHLEEAIEENKKLNKQGSTAARNSRTIAEARQHIETYEKVSSISGTTATSTIAYQLRMMDRYILPPVFDFTLGQNNSIEPFVMYFFEFNAELDQKDLSNIWQNIYPESAESTASPRYSRLWMGDPSRDDVVYSSHILDSSVVHQLQGTSPEEQGNLSNYYDPESFVKNEPRWLVFKCKYRALNNYSYLKDVSIEPALFFESKPGADDLPPALRRRGRSGDMSAPFSYNWPYDYFSFVELIKLENKVDFYSIGLKEKPRRTERPTRPGRRRPRR